MSLPTERKRDMTTANVDELLAAIKAAGSGLVDAGDRTEHLNCEEIQPMIELLARAGFRRLARDLMTAHASGDDDMDDLHHDIYLSGVGQNDSDPDDLADALIDARLRGEPQRKFRILLPDGQALDYQTKGTRDHEARHWADTYGFTVITELWDVEHPQDELNQGWACDGVVKPTPAETTV
jgi:hypothetical protein